MKKIILATLSVLCLVSCNQSEKTNDLTEENLKGKVKSITENTYEAVEKFGQIEKDITISSYFHIYNEKGNKIEENDYDSDGRLDEKYTYKYEYDKNNNWTQQVQYFNNRPIQITERIIEYYP